MVESILNGLKAIGDFFSSVWSFLKTIVQDTVTLIKTISSVVDKIPQYLSFLPTTIVVMIAGLLTIIILYKVLGRD